MKPVAAPRAGLKLGTFVIGRTHPRCHGPQYRQVYVEYTFSSNPLSLTHTYRQGGNVAQFVNKDEQGG